MSGGAGAGRGERIVKSRERDGARIREFQCRTNHLTAPGSLLLLSLNILIEAGLARRQSTLLTCRLAGQNSEFLSCYAL